MNQRPGQRAFTLIEMLVAMAVIVSILTMVYGSYVATARSADAATARIIAAQDARTALARIARQIRCAYARPPRPADAETKKARLKTNAILNRPVNYFKGRANVRAGRILRLTTTAPLENSRADGLFDVVYTYDRIARTLFASIGRSAQTDDAVPLQRDWRPLIENLDRIELAFFDGVRWLPEWDYDQAKTLPAAVSIAIHCRDRNDRPLTYTTVAHVQCRNKLINSKAEK